MTPAAVGLGVALALALLVWLVARTVLKMRRDRRQAEARRLVAMRGEAGEGGVDPRAAAVIRDAERVLGRAREEARKIVEEAEAHASEIAAAAERTSEAQYAAARTDAERSLRRQQELAQRMRDELAAMIRGLLEEVERGLGTPLSNGHAVDPVPRDRAASGDE